MYRILLSALLFASVCVFSSAEAHDARLHKGKPTTGKVVSIDDQAVKLKTATGTVMVTLGEETKFEQGKETVTREELKPGQQIRVFGTKLPTGELVAREVLLPATDSPTASSAPHTSQHEKEVHAPHLPKKK
jgi:hypothetical protein